MKKAIVIGGTGMVGTQLIQLLLNSAAYSEVVSLVRKASGVKHPKLKENIIDFDQPENWHSLITGDVLFSTLGTTMAQAKTKDTQYKVDFTYQYIVAEIAAKNGISNYVLVSAAGANSKSKVFYSNMKGELENSVRTLPFNFISILRPGQLDGNRVEKRTTEKIALSIMYRLNKIGLFRRYRPILAIEVAQAMMNVAEKEQTGSYTLDEIFKLIQ